jgi:hypothetical protein
VHPRAAVDVRRVLVGQNGDVHGGGGVGEGVRATLR